MVCAFSALVLAVFLFCCGLQAVPWPHCRSETAAAKTGTFQTIAVPFFPGSGVCGRSHQDSEFVGSVGALTFQSDNSACVWCGKCLEVDAVTLGTTVTVEIVDVTDGTQILQLSLTAFAALIPPGQSEDVSRFYGFGIDVVYNLVNC